MERYELLKFVHIAAAIVWIAVIVLGFLLVWDGPWDLGMTWIWLALVLFAISLVLGVAKPGI